MKICFAIAACAGFAAAATAQNTRILFEARNITLNTGWSLSLDARKGDEVRVRLSVLFVGTQTVNGFAGMTLQPTLTNFLATDQPGEVGSAGLDPQMASDVPIEPASGQRCGRVSPFETAAPMTEGHPSGILTVFRDPGNILRFAGFYSRGPNDPSPRGVLFGQRNANTLGTLYNFSNSPVIFSYSFTIGSDHALGDVMTTDAVGIHLNRGTWYQNPFTPTGNPLQAPISDILNASVTIVPAHAGIGIFAVFACSTRRRSR